MTNVRVLAVVAAAVMVGSVGATAGSVGAGAGELDPSFGGDGIVPTDVGVGDDEGRGVAVGPRGGIVTAGRADNVDTSYDDFGVTRHRPNGAPDTSFGGDGKVTTYFGGGSSGATDVAIVTNGAVIAVGSAYDPAGGSDDLAVVRYRANGAIDTSFGDEGVVLTDVDGEIDGAKAVALDASGRIVVAGQSGPSVDAGELVVARYLPDGALDAAFGDGGIVRSGFISTGNAVVIDPEGGIVVAGDHTEHVEGRPIVSAAVVRLTADGAFDTGFGDDGLVLVGGGLSRLGHGPSAHGVAIDANGRIVIAGNWPNWETLHDDIAVVRFEGDGAVDESFGNGGITRTTIGDGDARVGDLDIGTFGRIVVAGTAVGSDGDDGDVVVLRHLPNGSLDTGFSGDGIAITDAGGDDVGADVAIGGRGNAIVAGAAGGADDNQFALLRYRGA